MIIKRNTISPCAYCCNKKIGCEAFCDDWEQFLIDKGYDEAVSDLRILTREVVDEKKN